MDCYRTISQIYQAKDKEFDVEEECRWSAGWCLFKIVSSLKRSKLHDDMEDFVKSFCSIFLATPMNPTSHFHWFSYKMRVTIATFVEDIGGRDYFKGSVHWAETGNQLLKIRGSRSPPPPEHHGGGARIPNSVGGAEDQSRIGAFIRSSSFEIMAKECYLLACKSLASAKDSEKGHVLWLLAKVSAKLLDWESSLSYAKDALSLVCGTASGKDRSGSILPRVMRMLILNCYEKLQMNAERQKTALDLILNVSESHIGKGNLENVKAIALAELHPSAPKGAKFSNCAASPFSFVLSFPKLSYAIAGDTVAAKLLITNNLANVDISLKSLVAYLSFGGKVPVEISGTSLELPRGSETLLDVSVPLPSSLANRRSSFQSASSQVSRKPYTSGYTLAGGATFGNEEDIVMGGLAVKCKGVELVLCNGFQVDVVGEYGVTEEGRSIINEDHLIHTWGALTPSSIAYGPMVLRVHGPLAHLQVQDITSLSSAVDGAVFRIVLKLTSGEEEACKDLTMEMSCINAFRSSNDDSIEKERRGAIFVEEHDGEDLEGMPKGWRPVGNDGSGTDKGTQLPNLGKGESVHVAIHLYRPPPAGATVPGEADVDKCRTDFSVLFWYNQVLEGSSEKEVRKRHSSSIEWGEPLKVKMEREQGSWGFMKGVVWPGNRAIEGGDIGQGVYVKPPQASSQSMDHCCVSNDPCKIRCLISSSDSSIPSILHSVKFGTEEPTGTPDGACSVKLLRNEGRGSSVYSVERGK